MGKTINSKYLIKKMTKKKYNKEELIELYITKNLPYKKIAEHYGVTYGTIRVTLSRYGITRRNHKKIQESKQEIIYQDSDEMKYLKKKGYNIDDIVGLAKALEKQGQANTTAYTIGGNSHKFILFGDTHIGHIQYDKQLMKHLNKVSKKEKVDFVAHTGDIFDGWYQNRPSSIFEQNAIGFDRQMAMAVEELSQLEVPIHFITGNHSYNTFVRGAGIEAGPVLETKLKEKGLEAYFLGNAEGDIYLNNTLLRLLHPDGGSAYAISYKPQKIVEALESGKKPNILAIGHFHKAEYLFYRNVNIFQTGTLCGQTKFMKGKGLAAHKGFWLVELQTKDNGQIDSIIPKFYPSYK